MSSTTVAFKGVVAGTPVKVGTEVFIQVCMPVVRAASQQATPTDLAQLYCGFFTAAFGSLVADFGHEQAHNLMQDLVASFGRMDLDAAARTQ